MSSDVERVRFVIDNRYYSLEVNGTSTEVMVEILKKQFGKAVEIINIPEEASYDDSA